MEEPSTRRSLSRGEWISIVLAVAILGAGGYLYLRGKDSAPMPGPATADHAAEPPEAVLPDAPAPAMDEGRVRSLLEPVSPDLTFRRWLDAGELVQAWTVVTDNVAEGVTPRKRLQLLAPKQPFIVLEQPGRIVIAPISYARYDWVADAVASVDAQALARAYRELRPAVEGAYRALGYPGASLDRVTVRALSRIEMAPVRDGEVEVVGDRGLYLFADPALERLGDIEKHLLRMGPRNTRILQRKAREIREALALPAEMARQAP
jgi:hypothetical protein